MLKYLYKKFKQRITGYVDVEELKRRGMKIGENVFIAHNVDFDAAHCWLISIGDNTIIAPYTHILAHDASTLRFLGYGKIGKVTIGKNCFIGLGTIILPNVSIGDNVIVGAGSVITHDIESGVVVAGNPAKVIMSTQEYIEKHKDNMRKSPVFPKKGWSFYGGITDENKKVMLEKLKSGIGYIE